MSPGPATYEYKGEFDQIKQKSTSPHHAHSRKGSVQLSRCSSGTEFQELTQVPKKQEAIMQELFSRLVHTVKIELSDLVNGNFAVDTDLDNLSKKARLNAQSEMNKKQFATKEKAANDAVIRGDFVVKVLKMPTGKNVGPGSYQSSPNPSRFTHNVRGDKQYQGILKANSGSKKKMEDLVDSFYESSKTDLTKIFNDSREILRRPSSKPPSRPVSMFQLNISEYKKGDTSMEHNQSATTAANEAKENGLKTTLRINNYRPHHVKKRRLGARKYTDPVFEPSPVPSREPSCADLKIVK